jgi:hypothetical protein
MDEININGSGKSFRSIVKELGFVWRKTINNQNILIEKHELRNKNITHSWSPS